MSLNIPGLDISPSTEVKPDRMRVLIHGLPGSGKTTLASTIAQSGKTLLVDLIGERGALSFKGAPYEKQIDVARPSSVLELTSIYKALAKGDHDYESVILDSFGAVQKSAMRHILGYEEDSVSEIRKGRSPATQQTWGQILECMTDVATFWMSLADGGRKRPMNVVFTCQTKAHEDDEGYERMYPDVSKGSRSIAMATPDYVLYCDIEEVMSDEGEILPRHVVRLGPNKRYATKARLPVPLRDKIPPVLGLGAEPLSLTTLGKTLGILK